MKILKQSTAVTFKTTPILASDGSPATGLTISQADVILFKNHGAGAQKNDATAATHDTLGCYGIPFNTTDTNTLGPLMICILESGALIWWDVWIVVAANVHNSFITNTGLLNVNTETAGGVTIPSTGGRIEVNATHVGGSAVSQASGVLNVNAVQFSGDATAADNAEAFFDGTGYAGGTIKLDVNSVQFSGDSTAADNAEAFFDGNGYAGGTIPLSVNLTQWRGTQPNTLTSGRVESLVGAMGNDVVTSAAVANNAIDGAAIASDVGTEIAAAVLASQVESEGPYTLQQAISILLSVVAGVTSGSGKTFKTPNGVATRVVATTNASRERTDMDLTPSS